MTHRLSHIWIGYFSDDAPEDYFSDHPENRQDGKPMNRFAEEQGQLFFDYDFTEISFAYAAEAKSPREFIDGHSYSESYLKKVATIAKRIGLELINVFVIANEDEFSSPRSANGDGYRLEYLGLFRCEE